jgi:acetamidase/formamidase
LRFSIRTQSLPLGKHYAKRALNLRLAKGQAKDYRGSNEQQAEISRQGGKDTLPESAWSRAIILPRSKDAAAGPGPHIITGPIYVRGAAVGDALQIDILDVKMRQEVAAMIRSRSIP